MLPFANTFELELVAHIVLLNRSIDLLDVGKLVVLVWLLLLLRIYPSIEVAPLRRQERLIWLESLSKPAALYSWSVLGSAFVGQSLVESATPERALGTCHTLIQS